MPCRIVVAVAAALSLGAAPASAADYCVGPEPPCLPTFEEALEAARASPGADRVLLPAGEHEAPAGAADGLTEPVEIVGAGATTRIVSTSVGAAPTLALTEPASRVSAVTITAAPGPTATETLLLAGVASRVVVSAPDVGEGAAIRMLAGARVADAVVDGPVAATAPVRIERSSLDAGSAAAVTVDGGSGSAVLEDSELRVASADSAVDARCAGVVARHLTIAGEAARAFDLTCAEERVLDLRDSIVHGTFGDVVRASAAAVATSTHSAHAEDATVTATARLEVGDPMFVSATDLRPRPGSPLVDAGEPGALSTGEGFWDRGGRGRLTDGDGDGGLRRDVGAHELQPAPPAVPAGNVLFNPGAEQGTAILTTEAGPEPPGWTRMGSFTQVAYGTAPRTAQGADIAMPSREMGDALAAGSAFFSAGPGEVESRLVQRIDVAPAAGEIDSGLASAALSALIGGYGADEDEARVTATFRDPAGVPLGTLGLGPVTPADRGNATNLLHRSAAGAIPPRTRAIDVEILGTRVSAPGSAEVYADGYADNLSLVLSVPGVPVQGPVDPGTPPVKNLKPFAGITVLDGRPRLSPKGRTRIGIACASATVARCSGTLELRAQLRRGLAFTRIAQFGRFTIGPGRSTTVTMKLTLAARRALRRVKSFRATLRAVVQDGQGLERRTTIPILVMRSAARRR